MSLRHVCLVALVGLSMFVSGCGDSVPGTYTGPEGLTIELKSDGKAAITLKGVGTHEGVYHVDGKKITINAGSSAMTLAVNDDGSLAGDGMTFKKK